MALRLLEIVVHEDDARLVQRIVEHLAGSLHWRHNSDERRVVYKVLTHGENVESVLEAIRSGLDDHRFQVVVTPVEGASPQPETDKKETQETRARRPARISREELYNDLAENTRVTPTFGAMVILSTIVAAVGLSRNNPSIIIGAMVIAPLLGPNMALTLATTIRDFTLGRRALGSIVVGVLLTCATSAVAGLVFPLDVAGPEIVSRTNIDVRDVVLALAAGAAGAIATTTGVGSSLVGVMVAVALLPPLVLSIMLFVGGAYEPAMRSGLLAIANVVCLNFAGTATYILRGIRPPAWSAEGSSRALAILVMLGWLLLLVAVTAAIAYISTRTRAGA